MAEFKNYICIDGRKAELTEEQLKALGIELPKASPFDRQKLQKPYYCITGTGKLHQSYELDQIEDRELHKAANYCADYDLMEYRRLYEILHRQLWRFAMENNHEYIKDDDVYDCKPVYVIDCDRHSNVFMVNLVHIDCTSFGDVVFYTEELAEKAITEIIHPFTDKHPKLKNYYKI